MSATSTPDSATAVVLRRDAALGLLKEGCYEPVAPDASLFTSSDALERGAAAGQCLPGDPTRSTLSHACFCPAYADPATIRYLLEGSSSSFGPSTSPGTLSTLLARFPEEMEDELTRYVLSITEEPQDLDVCSHSFSKAGHTATPVTELHAPPQGRDHRTAGNKPHTPTPAEETAHGDDRRTKGGGAPSHQPGEEVITIKVPLGGGEVRFHSQSPEESIPHEHDKVPQEHLR